ncbi:hypothetical protein [Bdellovibrio sp. HCB337]|uniref:hypothetical protein n=1 Tax=Bdellovibrio sp. HCB337 TaxID=3394358 RepID=UPI0039A6627B
MRSQVLLPLSLSLVAAVCGAAANLFYKKAATRFLEVPVWQNGPLFLGLLCFTLVLVLFISAFRMGGELLVVYPAYATTYIWALVFAAKFGDESISLWQYVGVGFIMLGVSFVGFGAQK